MAIIISRKDVYFEIYYSDIKSCKKEKPVIVKDVGKGKPQYKTKDDEDYILFNGLYFYKSNNFEVRVVNKTSKNRLGCLNFDLYDENSEYIIVNS